MIAPAARSRERPHSLGDVELFAGIPESELGRLEHFMARFEVAAGERLYRQGDHSACMHLIEHGRVAVDVEVLGGRTRSVAELGAGEILGEMSLLGAGTRTAGAIATEPTSGWVLYRAGFDTLRIDGGAGSVELMARITELAVSRLRTRYRTIVTELGQDARRPSAVPRAPALPAPQGLWSREYLHSLLCFRAFHDHDQIVAAIGDAKPFELARGSIISVNDGSGCQLHVVLRGAVDVSVRTDTAAQRVRLTGPGRFIGHVGILDDAPSPVAAHARDRVVLLPVPIERVRAMLRDPSAAARRLCAAIADDTARALQQAERPMARTHGGPPAALPRGSGQR